MRRQRLAVATMLGAMAGAVPTAAAFASTPTHAATNAAANTATTAATKTATIVRDDNATVCNAARKAVQNGTKDIVAQLRQAASQLRAGNKSEADATVKAVGPKFTAVGSQLQQVANTASDPNLKSALTGLSGEFTKAGQTMQDVNSLRKFDESGIQAKGRQVGQICGGGSSSSPAPGQTA